MRSKISLFNKAVFKHNIRGNMGLWIGLTAIYLLVLPLYLYLNLTAQWAADLSLNHLHEYRISQMVEHIWRMRMFVPLFAVAAVAVAIVVFSYLFTGRNANMMHTFPVTRMGLFCTNYATGVLYLVMPQIISAVLSLLVGASMNAVDGQVVKNYFLWIGVAAVETVFFFSMAVCVLMFAGNAAAAAVFYLILNFLYEGCCLIIAGITSIVCYGVDGSDRTGPLAVLTPIRYMRGNILVVETGENEQLTYQFLGGRALAGYFAAAVVLFAIAVFVYQKKHLETAGDVITVGWLKPVFRWGTAVCCSALGTLIFCSEFSIEASIGKVLVISAVLALLTFFVAQMVLERSMRVFTKRRIWEGAAMAACLCALYLGLDNDLFGFERKIPKENEIKAVVVDSEIGLYAHTPEEVSWVRGIHKQIIDSKKEFELAEKQRYRSDGELTYVYFNYLLKDGSIMRRSYRIPVISQPESVSSQITAYTEQPDVILKSYFGIHYPDVEVYGATLDMEDGSGSHRVSQKDAKKLYKAVVQDAKEGHFSIQEEPEAENSDKSVMTAEEDDQFYGTVTFDVHDEQGFIAVSEYTMGYLKDTAVDFWIDPSKTCVLDTIKKLGY